MKTYDYIIIGAGIYGLYIARKFAMKYPKKRIMLLEYEDKPFQRASYINQARIHKGYHYPRSISTALRSAGYYKRFIDDFDFAVNDKFEKIYAISSNFSYASGENFEKFCEAADIPCKPIDSEKFFRDNAIEECFTTEEYALDAKKICKYFVSELSSCKNVNIIYGARMQGVEQKNDRYEISLKDGVKISSDFVLNTTYASVNQILDLFGFEKFKVKYEITELALCKVSKNIEKYGLTVMDGPFFSLMPFGLSGYHTLSAVHYTPHKTSYDELPTFSCQDENPKCTSKALENCNTCPAKPSTAWDEMRQLAKKYLNDDIDMFYDKSLFAIKPILKSSEISDSRPTVIKEFSTNPTFISVLSGKFNTMYDLDEVLEW